MSVAYTEQNYENSVLELFKNLDYEHICGYDVERDFKNPLYEDILENAIRKVNKDLPEEALKEGLYKVRNIENGDLIQRNETFTDYLQNGVEVKYHKDGEAKYTRVYLVDYDNVNNNSFIVANQWTIVENSKKRPDIIVFLNGLPICIIELKSPSREETDASEAYLQLRNYMQAIPSLFQYNEICIMSDLMTSKAGTITSGEDRYMEWKTKDGNYENTAYAQFDTFFEGIFQKERLLDILKNYILFSKDGVNSTKIWGAYHQYFAVN